MPENSVEQPRCPQCNRSLTGRHNFCPHCGHDMRDDIRGPQPSLPVVPPAPSREEPAPPPVPPRTTHPRSVSPQQAAAVPRRRRFRIVDRRVLFGLLGLIDIPIIAILLYLLIKQPFLQPPQSLVCDELDPATFVQTRFQRGLSGELEEDTLFSGGTEYLIQDTLVVPPNRRLLIQPGARLFFEEGASIEVKGALYACGSEKEPITFTSEAGEPGELAGHSIHQRRRQVHPQPCTDPICQQPSHLSGKQRPCSH